jgi:hypothetical protein
LGINTSNAGKSWSISKKFKGKISNLLFEKKFLYNMNMNLLVARNKDIARQFANY